MFVAFGIRREMRMRHVDMWPAWIYNILPHYLIDGPIFEKNVIEYKMCVLIPSTAFV